MDSVNPLVEVLEVCFQGWAELGDKLDTILDAILAYPEPAALPDLSGFAVQLSVINKMLFLVIISIGILTVLVVYLAWRLSNYDKDDKEDDTE